MYNCVYLCVGVGVCVAVGRSGAEAKPYVTRLQSEPQSARRSRQGRARGESEGSSIREGDKMNVEERSGKQLELENILKKLLVNIL